MVTDLKHFDGSLRHDRPRAGRSCKALYATAFEVEPKWLVEAGARRQKWIDQAQSLNIYMAGASGKKLDETYKLAWLRGLKTTYYLRTLAATHAEKSTGKGGELNAVSSSGMAARAQRRQARARRRRRSSAPSTTLRACERAARRRPTAKHADVCASRRIRHAKHANDARSSAMCGHLRLTSMPHNEHRTC